MMTTMMGVLPESIYSHAVPYYFCRSDFPSVNMAKSAKACCLFILLCKFCF